MLTKENKKFIIQVDPNDQPLGLIEKKEAHLKGLLHRAFSIFIFRHFTSSIQLLLQKRARSKYHSGGLWTNTCCSHAEDGVPIELTAKNRLLEEMGFDCPLHFVGSFYYKANVGNTRKFLPFFLNITITFFYYSAHIKRTNPLAGVSLGEKLKKTKLLIKH